MDFPAVDYQVIAAAPYWSLNGVNIFSANLVRGLIKRGVQASLLLTEQDSGMVTIQDPMMALPQDIPVNKLPQLGVESWGGHWGAMIRYLEERAPCVYIPNDDWRHSNVCSQLSPEVRVVGVVHSDDPLHYDHVARLGRYWDAVVTTSRAIAAEVIARNPALAERVRTIPIGVPIPERTSRCETPGLPLRLVYQGRIVQRQKRVFDLPQIVEQALRRGIPVELTVVGDGSDRDRLMAMSRDLIESGAVRFMGLVPHGDVMEMLGRFDICLLTSEFEGMPNALAEAMAAGCIPIVTGIRSGIGELVRDGQNGFLVPVGDVAAFVDRLAILHASAGLRASMSAKARDAVIAGGFGVASMAERYESLFRCLFTQQGTSRFRRPQAGLRMPPYAVNGMKIFALPEAHRIGTVGVLPSRSWDYNGYARELDGVGGRRLPPWRQSLMHPYPNVIVSATSGRLSGVDVFSVNLVRGLRSRGRAAHVLLTCPDDSTPDPMPLPGDIAVTRLAVSNRMPWPARWRSVATYLERNAPCIYIPNYDWRHSCISPTLSQKVGIVGIVHSDDPIHYEHVSRLGRYWNAVVAVSRKIADRVVELDPSLAPRLVTIPYGVEIPQSLPLRKPSPNGRLRVVYAGRLVQAQKRVMDLQHIFEALLARGIPAELTIVGGGEDEAALKQACSAWIAGGQVCFTGIQSNEEVLRIFGQNDIVILTSEFEGLPLSLLEAMAHGCVPVVTDIQSGIPEVVLNGETGYRLPVGDIGRFAECLAKLHSDRAHLRLLSETAHDRIRAGGYGVEDMVSAYMSLFERVLVEAELGEFRRPRGEILPPPNSPWMTNPWQRWPGGELLHNALSGVRSRLRWTH